jgi:hypothetical protein
LQNRHRQQGDDPVSTAVVRDFHLCDVEMRTLFYEKVWTFSPVGLDFDVPACVLERTFKEREKDEFPRTIFINPI